MVGLRIWIFNSIDISRLREANGISIEHDEIKYVSPGTHVIFFLSCKLKFRYILKQKIGEFVPVCFLDQIYCKLGITLCFLDICYYKNIYITKSLH